MHFIERLKEVKTLDKSYREQDEVELTAALTEALASFTRGYDKLATKLESLIPLASQDAGIWRFPKGEEMYSYFLRFYTTTNLTAKEIHETGIGEVER